MKTGLTKREKTTDIFFDEAGAYITVCTHNTDLKNRLSAFAGTYPTECRLVARDRESGLLEFEVKKGRLSFRLTAPYSAERRKLKANIVAAVEEFGFKIKNEEQIRSRRDFNKYIIEYPTTLSTGYLNPDLIC